ncbi:polysaccharide chain length determinant protein (PEP-CTERM system associated) [Sphaerotilus mobilis]|uniref:Polysaccharide chain length determinant protein (PEP-CTERM system associated) n=2 Tax=Sphaerotilus mobilis TaxID=47994 RepID=A0A4Q7LG51_9BURK|nr:polysaccharide chain length determinant protein (PEP-CTERM system associated) [Sphaerotilus mobilis]
MNPGMNEISRQVAQAARGVWRYRWLAVSVTWAFALVGAAVVWLVPERFAATARVYVDTQTVLKPLMAGLAFQPDVDQQVRMLGRTLISRPNIEVLVKDPAIGLGSGNQAEDDRTIETLMKSIKVENTGGPNMYVLSYRDPDSERALRLVDALVNLFMASGTEGKRKDSQDASRFIDEQIKVYEAKLIESENRLKDFKLRNLTVASTTNQDYFARMGAMTDEINKLRTALSAAEQSRDAIKRELATELPALPVEAASAPSSLTPELDARLDAQRRQLDDLLRRYTDAHPDVITTRRTVAQLEEQRRVEQEAKARVESARPKVTGAATNPVYQRLRISLTEAEANVASLRAQVGTQQVRLEEIRAQAGRMPQAEAELAQLNRDYDIIRKNYEQLVSRREAASLGVKIDQTASIADFRLIEPPRVLPQPVFPSRTQLALALMVLALLAGIGTAWVMTLLKPTFSSERELREFTKRPVLGGLTRIVDGPALDLLRQERLRIAGAAGLFLLGHIGWIAFVAMHSGS